MRISMLAGVAVLGLASIGTVQAFTGDSQDEPFSIQGRPQVFAHSTPGLNLGSEAYPTTTGLGADSDGRIMNHVTRVGWSAYQHGFDVGSEAYPAPR